MERDRDARGIALRQELLQSGLSLGMHSSATDNRRKEESKPPGDTIFSLGSTTLKSRLADVRLGSFASDKGDVTLSEKASRREADNMSGLEDRRSTNTTLQYDPRVDAVRAVSQMSLQSDGVSLSLQGPSGQNNRPLFRPGSMTQRTQAHSGLPPNSHSNDALQKPFSKDPSPKPQESPIASPKGPIFEHGPPPGSQQNIKLGQRRRTPNVREGKGMIPSGSPQQQAMQRQPQHQQQVLDQRESKGVIPPGSMQQQAALQQQALHQQAQQALHQQMFEARDSKGLMSGGVPQQQALQQASMLQQQALHQQAADARESKGMMSIRSSQQQALQQQMALKQQLAMQQMALQQQQQTRDARENKNVISPGSPQQQTLQQQQSLHQQQATLQQQALHAIMEARENKGGMSPGSPQQQALQQQANMQQLQLHALQQRVYEGKGMNPAVVPQQPVLQQQAMQPGRHQQVLDSRDSKGMMSVGSPQQQALLQQAALQQQARHQQVLDGRESKSTISTGSPQQQALQQQSPLDQKALQQQARHQQVLDSRENKGVMASGSPQQQSLQQSFHQQPVMALHQQTVSQQALDARESKGMIPSGKHSVQQQSSLQQQTSPQQQAIYQHVLDSRDSKGLILPGSPQQQALQQQPPLQQQASHLQVLETKENKGVLPSGTSLQQNLQQQALHQQVLDSRENKGNMQPASPQLQAFQQQALHPQGFEARESKGMMTSAASPQQQALYQQVLDARESKGMVGAGSPKQQAGPQQSLHSQVVNARDSRISQAMTLQQQALHKQGLDARESNGMVPTGSSQPHVMQLSQQQAIQQQAMNLQGRHQQLMDSRDSKSMVPSDSSQQQALHVAQLRLVQQHFHQQALQQFQQGGTHQTLPPHPSQTLHLSESCKVGYQHPQMHSSEQLSTPQRSGTLHLRGAYLASQAKPEPVELEVTPIAERSVVQRATVAVKLPLADSSSPKESVSVAETDEAIQFGLKKLKTEESRPSMSFNSAAESKDSVRSGSRREGGDGRHPQSQSSGRTSRETMFADLNAEPPASDGEDEGPVPSDGVPMVAQPESSRTTTEEKRKRKKAVKDPKLGKDGEEVDNKKVIKPAKSRAKPKGEVTLDPGMEGDGDNHLDGVPTTKEEKIKSLKAGLVHVARKLPKNAHAHFSLGLMHQRWGHYTKAAQAFRQAAEILTQLEEETGHSRRDFLATVQVHQAQCLLQESLESHLGPGKELNREELESVVSRLKEATMVETGQSAIWSTLGFLLLRSGKIESSIYVLKALLEIVPDQVDGLANLGVAYLHSDELEKAKSCFLSVFDKQDTHPGALLNYATLLLRQYGSSFSGAGAGAGPGAYATRVAAARAAQQCLEAALKEDPKAAHIWVNLAAAYSTLGSIPQASLCLEQAVRLEPTRMSTRYAVAAHRVKDAERRDDGNEQLVWAANEMASILREGDFTSIQPRLAWGGLAMVNRAQHETAAAFEGGGSDLKEVEDRALHTLQQAIEEDPADAVQWHQMGLHTLCTLQFGPAQNYLKTAISRRWANPSAWSNLGIALQLSEDPSLAEGVYKQALAIAPKEQAHSILSNLGNLYRQQRKFNEAHEVFKRALDLCPEYAPACNNLGLLLVAEGKWDDAIATFDRSLRADPFLDAAKSNRMKAVALAQMRQSEAQAAPAVPQTSLPVAAAVTPEAPIPVSVPVESASVLVSNPSAQNPGPEESPQREPFPLLSIS